MEKSGIAFEVLQISLTSGLTEDSWILTPAFAFFNLS
jgi:hypothetical protein